MMAHNRIAYLGLYVSSECIIQHGFTIEKAYAYAKISETDAKESYVRK
jgi:hypothetical protein